MGTEQPEEKSKLLKWLLPWLLPLGATIIIVIIGYAVSVGRMESDIKWIKDTLGEIRAEMDKLDGKANKGDVHREQIMRKIDVVEVKVKSIEEGIREIGRRP